MRLRNTTVTDAGLKHLVARLSQLQQLDIASTHITDAGLEYLKGLTRLQTLDLDGTQITYAGLEHLKNWHNSESCTSSIPMSQTRREEAPTGVAQLQDLPLT